MIVPVAMSYSARPWPSGDQRTPVVNRNASPVGGLNDGSEASSSAATMRAEPPAISTIVMVGPASLAEVISSCLPSGEKT